MTRAHEGDELTVLRCRDCGDGFPAKDSGAGTCPTCGSERLTDASEPLL